MITYIFTNYPDQRLDTLPQIELVTETIEEALKVIKPDIIYIHNF